VHGRAVDRVFQGRVGRRDRGTPAALYLASTRSRCPVES